jgi:hypothetical protein
VDREVTYSLRTLKQLSRNGEDSTHVSRLFDRGSWFNLLRWSGAPRENASAEKPIRAL